MTLEQTASPTKTRAQSILLKAPAHGTIARDALRFFRSSSYSELRTIQCESREGVLILRGQVSTFFMKQLAQERIRSIEGVLAVINDLQVVDPSGCDQTPVKPIQENVTSEDVRRDAGHAVETATQFSQQSKDEFQKGLEVRLHDLDAEISKRQEKGRNLTDHPKANWDHRMAELEIKRDAARARLVEIGQASNQAWAEVKKGA